MSCYALELSAFSLQDMDILTQIEWEAMVVDECQQPRTLSFFEEFKKLKTESRLLLFNGNTKVYILSARILQPSTICCLTY